DVTFGGDAKDVVRADRLAGASKIDQALHDRRGPGQLVGIADHRDRVAALRNPPAEGALQLEIIGLVLSGKQQRIRALDTDRDTRIIGAHEAPASSTRTWSAANSAGSTRVGAPSKRA